LSRVWERTKGGSNAKRSLAYEAINDPEMPELGNYALCGNKGKMLKTTKKTTGKEIPARARPVVVSCISRMPTKAR
jgi:hypothetical protein